MKDEIQSRPLCRFSCGPHPPASCRLPTLQVEAKKERLLSKRVQSLSRFLLEALNKECVAGACMAWCCRQSGARPAGAPSSVPQQPACAVGAPIPACSACRLQRSGAAAPPGHLSCPPCPPRPPAGGRPSVADAVFGLVQRQRMQCLSRPNRPEQVKEARIFQVDLQYPPAKERPGVGGGGGTGGTASNPASAASSPLVRPSAPPSAPPALTLGPASAPGSPDAAAAARAVAAGNALNTTARPSFAELLQGSLKVQSEMRAWFDEEVRQRSCLPVRAAAPAGARANMGPRNATPLCFSA